jgi:hypothetical protein
MAYFGRLLGHSVSKSYRMCLNNSAVVKSKWSNIFYVLLAVHLGIILVNNQLGAQFFFYCKFIAILYMFRATSCSSSGESIVSIQLLIYVTVCKWPSGVQITNS